MPRAPKDTRGFTLTELLVVVAIIVLLTSIVVPNIAGRLTIARMHAAEDQIVELETALAAYHADFGTYPGDVFPTEDKNNNGRLDWNDVDNDGVVDPGESEDRGVDVNGDGTLDYACTSAGAELANNRLDRGDGVINIYDLEWALKTTEKNGPYLESIPLDPWKNKYVYYAPLQRPIGTNAADDFLYLDPTTMRNEDGQVTLNGKLEANEDIGIARYATTNANVRTGFAGATGMWAGAGNGVLDHGDDDNKNGNLEYYQLTAASGTNRLEWGNVDVSPDGLARNMGYYIYCVGRNGKDESATGYENISFADFGDSQLNTNLNNDGAAGSPFSEDINSDGTLDTGYEDTGIDGIPGTKDVGEDDWDKPNTTNPTVTLPDPPGTPGEEFGTQSGGPTTWHYNRHHTPGNPSAPGFDIGGDDINSWNKRSPWRENPSYGG